MVIDLENYVDKLVEIHLRNGNVVHKTIKRNRSNSSKYYPYYISGLGCYNRDGNLAYSVCSMSSDIIKISLIKPMEFTGIAQKRPNIDLEKFVGKNVLIKLNKESSGLSDLFFGSVGRGQTGCVYQIGQFNFTADGIRSLSSSQHIIEIYDEDAFYIHTKQIETIDDPAVEKAKEAVKALSEEQIAKLLYSLNS